MTVRETILDVLATSNQALTQAQIASLGGLVPSSVRRECQKLEARVDIVCDGFKGSAPMFVLSSNRARVREQVAPDTTSAVEMVVS